ncbi:hypothetical protein CHARACLAT_020850 [Characodon lateralis]|uniref:Nitrite reductase n=3 Tax=Goodeidae TaxID=28758 RepID=A0ABU7F5Q5_9TELE|nr:hypothetical protein [Characodon lateralis]
MSVCVVVCVLPCDGLATCPGCTLPPAHRVLEIGTSSPVTHYGISGMMGELSVKDKELIRGSWESLGKNKVPHGVIMFSRLFELDPALLSLFHYSTNCDSKQDCLSSPEFLDHVTKVMLVIDAAVNHLDDLHSLEDFLLNLGRKHQAVGVSTQSFTVVGESLLYMLQCSLGQAYTAPLRQAWLNMYSIVVGVMSRGWAKNGDDKAD